MTARAFTGACVIARVLRAAGPEDERNNVMATANERAASGEAGKAAETGTNGPEGFINKPTVAGRMTKCPRTIDNMMAQGMPHYKVGRSVIFKWSEVEAWLAANCRVSRRGGVN